MKIPLKYFDFSLANIEEISQRYSLEELLEKAVLLLDKPPNITSHEASAYVKKILEAKKSGHTGTLDPKVTGVLVVGINKTTRFLEYLSGMDKEYICVARFYSSNLSETVIRNAFRKFIGRIKQHVPKMAAVRRTIRTREIKKIEIFEIRYNKMTTDVLFSALVEKGTYIRVLCEDIGKTLGVKGTMLELRRTKVGPFTHENCTTLQNLWRAKILWKEYSEETLLRKILYPIEVVNPFPEIIFDPKNIARFRNGANVYVDLCAELTHANRIAILDDSKKIVGIGKIQQMNSNWIVIPEKVF